MGRHIEAFPSFVRLLNAHALVEELQANIHRLDGLRRVRFHRVIDNKELELDGADLWIQLNYQVVHLLDFLPASNWIAQADAPIFLTFRALHAFLSKAGKLD